MSIRLRLTLLYSGILALTLITFSGILYVTQAQTTLHEAKKELAGRAEYQIAKSPWHLGSNRDSTPRNDSSRIGSVAQVRSLAGDVLYSSPNLGETFILPLSDETLAEAQYGDKNVEVNTVGDERLLIYSKPYTSDDGRPLIMQVAMSLEDHSWSRWFLLLDMNTIVTSLGNHFFHDVQSNRWVDQLNLNQTECVLVMLGWTLISAIILRWRYAPRDDA